MAKTRFDDRTLVLVQGGGLRYEDSAATRGISFWKAAARKVYAVKADDGVLAEIRSVFTN